MTSAATTHHAYTHPTAMPAAFAAPYALQAKTRKLAERKVSKAELEEMERRRRAEEAEEKDAMVRDLRCEARRDK
jgi:hypothetical protein